MSSYSNFSLLSTHTLVYTLNPRRYLSVLILSYETDSKSTNCLSHLFLNIQHTMNYSRDFNFSTILHKTGPNPFTSKLISFGETAYPLSLNFGFFFISNNLITYKYTVKNAPVTTLKLTFDIFSISRPV